MANAFSGALTKDTVIPGYHLVFKLLKIIVETVIGEFFALLKE